MLKKNTDSHVYEKGPLWIATKLVVAWILGHEIRINRRISWAFPLKMAWDLPSVSYPVAHRLAGRRAEIMGYGSWLWCRHQCFGDELEKTEGAAVRTAGRFFGRWIGLPVCRPERKRIFESSHFPPNCRNSRFHHIFSNSFPPKSSIMVARVACREGLFESHWKKSNPSMKPCIYI